jgi:phosphate transport system substrate-binding protein
LIANKDKIKAAKEDGKVPSLASIQDYSYGIASPLFLYVKKAQVGVIPGM